MARKQCLQIKERVGPPPDIFRLTVGGEEGRGGEGRGGDVGEGRRDGED